MKRRKIEAILFCLALSGLLVVGLFLVLSQTAQEVRASPGQLFVTPGGSGDCSQSNPCNLQTALSSSNNGDEIYLAQGTYTSSDPEVLKVTKNLTFYGGWNGTTTSPPVRDPLAYPTILDGEEQRCVVLIQSGTTVILDGLTIMNGKMDLQNPTGMYGAGLFAADADLTVRHTRFYSNVVDINANIAYGGGMMVKGGSLSIEKSSFKWNSVKSQALPYGGGLAISDTLTATVREVLFERNDAWIGSGLFFTGNSSKPPVQVFASTFRDNGWGYSKGTASGGYSGAMEIVNATAHIEGNTMDRNYGANEYGAMRVMNSEIVLLRNLITRNESYEVSALAFWYTDPLIMANNIVVDNQTTAYSFSVPAIEVKGSSGEFLHNTLARNRNFSGSNVGEAYGILVHQSSNISLTNNIVVSHTVGIYVDGGSTANLEGTLWGSDAWANGTDTGGGGSINTGAVNLWKDPAFLDPNNGNYHLSLSSPAIDAGVLTDLTSDIDGGVRPTGSGFDIGADEIAAIYLPLVLKLFP
ncbi:MAG: Fibronectin type III domain protein [Anaerolineae bacterium]|nr:MAG: Fibronectin type III domain protein [Anaerolineae bacterium]